MKVFAHQISLLQNLIFCPRIYVPQKFVGNGKISVAQNRSGAQFVTHHMLWVALSASLAKKRKERARG